MLGIVSANADDLRRHKISTDLDLHQRYVTLSFDQSCNLNSLSIIQSTFRRHNKMKKTRDITFVAALLAVSCGMLANSAFAQTTQADDCTSTYKVVVDNR